jgi:hypothetical protein
MMYIGEFLNNRFLANLNRAMLGVAAIMGVALIGLGATAFMEQSKIASMKEEISIKSKAIADAQAAAKAEAEKPAKEKIPTGLAAIGAFQTRVNRLAGDHGCSVTQFQASDQMNPFISTFGTGEQSNGAWTQVEVKLNLLGTTRAVIDTLNGLAGNGIPFEFTSVEMSRTQASPTGEATVTANVSLRVLTIPGGA